MTQPYVLHTATPAFGVPSASPFGTKAESLVRLAGVPWRREYASPIRGPRKKIPWLTCPDGTVICDTINIRDHLREAAGLELPVTPHDVLVRRLLEDHLYWIQVYFRWVEHPSEVRDQLFGDVPSLVRPLVFGMVRRQVMRDLWGHGLGRRPRSEILAVLRDDLDALEYVLEGRRFVGGDVPSDADLTLHGTLDQILPATFDDELTRALRARPRLVEVHRALNDVLRDAVTDPAA